MYFLIEIALHNANERGRVSKDLRIPIDLIHILLLPKIRAKKTSQRNLIRVRPSGLERHDLPGNEHYSESYNKNAD